MQELGKTGTDPNGQRVVMTENGPVPYQKAGTDKKTGKRVYMLSDGQIWSPNAVQSLKYGLLDNAPVPDNMIARKGVAVGGRSEEGILTDARKALPIAVGSFLNRNEAARADMWKKQYPDAEFGRDSDGRQLIKLPGDEWRYINQPGINTQSVTDFAGDVVKFAPAGKAATMGGGLLSKIGIGSVASGATEATAQKASEALGSEQGIRGVDVALAAGGAGAGEVVSAAISPIARPIGRYLGKKIKEARGVTSTKPPVLEALEKGTLPSGKRNVDGAIAAEDLARQFDVDLTAGQATGDVVQQRIESQMAKGVKGGPAMETMRAFQGKQTNQVRQAANNMLGARVAPDMDTAGSMVARGLRSKEQALNKQVDHAYKKAAEYSASVDIHDARQLRDVIRGSLPEEVTNPSLFSSRQSTAKRYEQTFRVMEDLDRFDKNLARARASIRDSDKAITVPGSDVEPAELVGIDWREIEKFRKDLRASLSAAKTAEDRAGVMMAKASLDGWLDGAVTNGLIKGDPAFLKALKKARAARTLYGERFEVRNPKDFSGKIINDIVSNDLTPSETVNLIFGSSSALGQKRGSQLAVRQIKEILGPDSQEWQALREAALDKMVRQGFSRGGTQMKIGTFREAWNRQLKGEGRYIIQELFSPEERARMEQFEKVLGFIEPLPGAVNNSDTGTHILAMLNSFMRIGGRVPQMIGKRLLKEVDPAADEAARAVAGAPRPIPNTSPALGPVGAATALNSKEPENQQ